MTALRRLLEDPANNRVAAAARNPHGSAALQSLSKTYGDDRLLLVKMDTTDTESIKVCLLCTLMVGLPSSILQVSLHRTDTVSAAGMVQVVRLTEFVSKLKTYTALLKRLRAYWQKYICQPIAAPLKWAHNP